MMRRFRRPRGKPLALLLAVVVLIAARYGYDRVVHRHRYPRPVALREGPCQLVRVVAGDVLVVRQHIDDRRNAQAAVYEATVRLIGVACPAPSHPMSRQATGFTADFLNGVTPQLRFDRRRINHDGEFLAYVHVGQRMLNVELARAGLASPAPYPGDSQSLGRKMQRAADEAKRAGRGIWSSHPAEDRGR